MVRFEETNLSEVERHVLGTIDRACGQAMAYGLSLPEGKMADTAAELVRRGYLEEHFGYYAMTDAGRSQLRANR